MKRILSLPFACVLACAAFAGEPNVPASTAAMPTVSAPSDLPTLDTLEQSRTASERFSTERTRQTIALISAGRVTTGQDFLRAARLVEFADVDFDAARVRYELLLAASALHAEAAEPLLSREWNRLLESLGRAPRIKIGDEKPARPGLALDPAPAAVQAVFRDPAAARARAAVAARNEDMKAIVDADQADRRGDMKVADWNAISARDSERETRTLALLNAGALHTAADFANASLVMQHSDGFAGYQTAHELAVCALLLGDRRVGRWLVAATYDRMLGSIGHAQRFGTQYRGFGGGRSSLVRVDETGICDAERVALGCPSLAAARSHQLDNPTAPRSRSDVKIEIGADHRLRDAEYGISAAVPEPWRIENAFRWGERQTTIHFLVEHAVEQHPSLYFKVYTSPQPVSREELPTWYRAEATAKEASRRQDDPGKEYKNRPDSFAMRELGGKTMFSWVADYQDEGEPAVEYMVNFRTATVNVFLFASAPAAKLGRLQADADAFMASLAVPETPK